MKLKSALVILATVALCYVGAGAPPIALLFKPAVLVDGFTLNAITYHWANSADRALPVADLLASRFYVLLLAAVTAFAAFCALKADREVWSYRFALAWSAVIVVAMFVGQARAFYTVG
jgi:hypothetical protein